MSLLKRFLNRCLSKFKDKNDLKTPLPVGLNEFHAWADDVISLTPLPNNESIKFAVATIILELTPDDGYISKRKVATRLIKAAANQVASYYFQSIKSARMDKDAKAEKLASLVQVNDQDLKGV